VVASKVIQLEAAARKMVRRHLRHSGINIHDAQVTRLIGAAVFSFKLPTGTSRKDHARDCMTEICDAISPTRTPLLYSLARSHRVFMCVLSRKYCPTTEAMHGVSQAIKGTNKRVDKLQATTTSLKQICIRTEAKLDHVCDIITEFVLGGSH
jgi:hypothetical protein